MQSSRSGDVVYVGCGADFTTATGAWAEDGSRYTGAPYPMVMSGFSEYIFDENFLAV